MKICLVTEHYPPHIGGVEVVFHEYATRLASRGHEVKVVTSNSGGITGIRDDKGIEVHYTPCLSLFGHPVIRRKNLETAVAWADIVHTTVYTAAAPALTVAKKYRKPCILMVHEVLGKKWFLVETNPLKALAFSLFEYWSIHRAYTAWQTVSHATAKDLEANGIPSRRIRTIYHGIDQAVWNENVAPADLAGLLGFPESSRIFLYNGRLGKTKGCFLLLDAIRELEEELAPEIVFGFIIPSLSAKERFKIKAYVQKHGLHDRVRIHEALPYAELPGYRKGAYAVVIPSLTEGFGFVAAESAALNVPLISSDSGSLPEVVSGRYLLFKSKSRIELKNAIVNSLQSGFKESPHKHFSWDSAIDQILSLYTESL